MPSRGRPAGSSFGRFAALSVSTNDFATYWKQYAGREYSASWFEAKLKRADRQATPIQPEYREDIQRVTNANKHRATPILQAIIDEYGWNKKPSQAR